MLDYKSLTAKFDMMMASTTKEEILAWIEEDNRRQLEAGLPVQLASATIDITQTTDFFPENDISFVFQSLVESNLSIAA